MERFIRWPDIQARGIANNRVTLNDLIRKEGFPEGKRLSAVTIAWIESEVDAWQASRPSASLAKPPKKGAVKMLANPDPTAPKPKPKKKSKSKRSVRTHQEQRTT
jgi:predicted DNA-binding transcriptional regulator AlpA